MKGSSEEVRSQFYRAFDFGYITQPELEEAQTMANKTSGAIQKLVEYLNRTEIKGIRNLQGPPVKWTKASAPINTDFPTEPSPDLSSQK